MRHFRKGVRFYPAKKLNKSLDFQILKQNNSSAHSMGFHGRAAIKRLSYTVEALPSLFLIEI